jgi:cytochrome P450 family 26 subfamily A
MKVLKQQLDERMNAAERKTVDFFDIVIHELNKPNSIMNENIALNLLFLLLFASHETTSMALTAILKFLTDNPKAMQELTVSKRFVATTLLRRSKLYLDFCI